MVQKGSSSNVNTNASPEEWKKKMDELKLQIKDLEHENEKLAHQKKNLDMNSKNFSKKTSVMGDKDRSEVKKNTYPMFFIMFVGTAGLIFGALLNKLF